MRRPNSPRRRIVVALVALATALATFAALTPAAPSAAAEPDTVRLLVTFRAGAGATAEAKAHRLAGASVAARAAKVRAVAVEVPAAEADAAVAAYRALPAVEWAGREGRMHAMGAPPDNGFPLQWNLGQGAPGATRWSEVYTEGFGAGVVVAVVDTGVGRGPTEVKPFDGFTHGFAPGYDFVNNDTEPYDEHGHGTHVAGTIAQRTGNVATESRSGVSVAGVAPDARIMPVRVLDAEGGGLPMHTLLGILWATDHGAKVVNLSLGGDFSKPVCDAVKYAVDRGVVVVAASGNESDAGMVPVAYPAACSGAIAVGGHRFDAARGSYSNGSCELAISAPGGDLSPDGRLFPALGPGREDPGNGILQEGWDPRRRTFDFFFESGTSMASAHVAGAAAVLMAPPYGKSAADVARLLRATARDVNAAGPDFESGSGALDIAGAVLVAASGTPVPVRERVGYWMVASDGGIFSFGDAPFLGSTGAIRLNSPIVSMVRTASGRGYWMVAADGGIFTFGDAQFFGSTGGLQLAQPIVGMAPYPDGRGYWLVARDGGIFSFHAPGEQDRYYGSMGGKPLNSPIVGIASNRTGFGYWLFAADGGVFAFNSFDPSRERAEFHGSAGGIRLNAPIVAGVPTPTGGGYWLVATDGGIFAYGDAAFHGSTGAMALNKPIVGMTPTCYGRGYWLVASDGGIFAFGHAPFLGSTGAMALNKPIVGMTVAADQRAGQL